MASNDKKRGLGRGLSALMADVAEPVVSNTTSGGGEQNVPIEKIKPNPNQPRRTFEQGLLDDLVASIKEKGVLQPLIVRAVDDGYEIVAGERRWRAVGPAASDQCPSPSPIMFRPWRMIRRSSRSSRRAPICK